MTLDKFGRHISKRYKKNFFSTPLEINVEQNVKDLEKRVFEKMELGLKGIPQRNMDDVKIELKGFGKRMHESEENVQNIQKKLKLYENEIQELDKKHEQNLMDKFNSRLIENEEKISNKNQQEISNLLAKLTKSENQFQHVEKMFNIIECDVEEIKKLKTKVEKNENKLNTQGDFLKDVQKLNTFENRIKKNTDEILNFQTKIVSKANKEDVESIMTTLATLNVDVIRAIDEQKRKYDERLEVEIANRQRTADNLDMKITKAIKQSDDLNKNVKSNLSSLSKIEKVLEKTRKEFNDELRSLKSQSDNELNVIKEKLQNQSEKSNSDLLKGLTKTKEELTTEIEKSHVLIQKQLRNAIDDLKVNVDKLETSPHYGYFPVILTLTYSPIEKKYYFERNKNLFDYTIPFDATIVSLDTESLIIEIIDSMTKKISSYSGKAIVGVKVKRGDVFSFKKVAKESRNIISIFILLKYEINSK